MSFSDLLRQWRTEKGLTQQQLADLLFVDRTTIVKWESGKRMPDTYMLSSLSKTLNLDVSVLLNITEISEEKPNVILVDDEKIILKGGMPILKNALPETTIIDFDSPAAALKFAGQNRVDIAFLDVEMGNVSGLDICSKLLEINPQTNVIFLTAYVDYAFNAWSTGASGFILKPLTVDKIKEQISRLRFPLRGG